MFLFAEEAAIWVVPQSKFSRYPLLRVEIFIDEFQKKGCVVRVIVRNRARFEPSIQKLCDDVVELQKISDIETLKAACEGIDCVISCMGNRSNEKSHNVTEVDYQVRNLARPLPSPNSFTNEIFRATAICWTQRKRQGPNISSLLPLYMETRTGTQFHNTRQEASKSIRSKLMSVLPVQAREKVIEKLQAQTKIAWTVFRSNMLFK